MNCAAIPQETLWPKIRRALAWPFYIVAAVLVFASYMLGRLAAWIAGDDWP